MYGSSTVFWAMSGIKKEIGCLYRCCDLIFLMQKRLHKICLSVPILTHIRNLHHRLCSGNQYKYEIISYWRIKY